MPALLFSCLASLITVFCAFLLFLPILRRDLRAALYRTLVLQALLFLLLALPCVAVSRFTAVGTPITVFASVLLSFLAFLGVTLARFLQKESLKRFLFRMACFAAAIFLLEVFLFNFKSYTAAPERKAIDLAAVNIEEGAEIERKEDGSLVFNGKGAISFDVKQSNLSAVILVLEGEDSYFNAALSIKDENASRQYVQVSKKAASAEYGKLDFSFRPYGELSSVRLQFTDVSSPITVRSGTLMSKLPFEFSNLRFVFLFLLVAALAAVSSFKLYKISYDRSNLKHQMALLLAFLLCVGAILCMLNPKEEPIKYPDAELKMSAQNPYVQTFDAFYHGRVHIDITPSEELLAMENPYDCSARREAGVSYSWDRAFYEGKYYSYYGATPVVTFYMPYYYLTGTLPTINAASVFFGALSILFLFLTVLSFVKRFIPAPNLLLLLLSLVASSALCGVYYQVLFSDMYVLPGVTSTCFLFLCLFGGIEACNQKKMLWRLLLLALAGLAFALCVGARPTKALSALILAPLFIGILAERTNLRKKIAAASAFLLPLLAGMALIMAYNYLRFDSPFEFGAKYQLTVNNVQSNTLSLSAIPFALMHYFAQPIRMASSFPYVQIAAQSFDSYGHYVYADFAAGALAFPSVFGSLAVLPFLWRYEGKGLERDARAERLIKRSLYLLIVLLSLLVAWLDFCMAGIIMSYVLDIMPLLALLSVFVFLEVGKKLSSVDTIGHKAHFLFSLLSVLSVVTVCAMLLSFVSRGSFFAIDSFYFRLEELFCFFN